jgi:predicted nuclease with TOPRIM domain
MKYCAILLALFVTLCVADREHDRKKMMENRAEEKEAIHEAIRLLSEQIQIPPEKRSELLKKLLRHEITLEEAVAQYPGKYQNLDKKFHERVAEISSKLKGFDITNRYKDYKNDLPPVKRYRDGL